MRSPLFSRRTTSALVCEATHMPPVGYSGDQRCIPQFEVSPPPRMEICKVCG